MSSDIRADRDCSVDECARPGGRRVTTDWPLCEKHYQQWRKGRIDAGPGLLVTGEAEK